LVTATALATKEAAVRAFAAGASRFANVSQLLLVRGEHGATVWSVLDGESGGTTRQELYALELALWAQFPESDLAFNVIDLSEFPPEQRERLLPSGAQMLYRRTA